MRLQLQSISDLLKRYSQAFRDAWSCRTKLDHVPRRRYETEFLPATLALQETPISPAPRVAMWLMIIFAALAVIWAIFGNIDVVAIARGKIIPNDQVKTIQPMTTAVIKVIYVNDGQQVKRGDALIKLDSTIADADVTRIISDLQTARLLALRDTALIQGLRDGKPVMELSSDFSADQIADEQRLLDSEWVEFKSKLERLDAKLNRHLAEIRVTQSTVKKLRKTVPLFAQLAEDYKKLLGDKFISQHSYIERLQARIEEEGKLATENEKLQELRTTLVEVKKEKAELIAGIRRTTLTRLHDSKNKIIEKNQELIKARQRAVLHTLTSPVNGIVQQLNVHTVGGVVTPAQALMVIVPIEQTLEIDAFVENKDIGFVNAGQDAEVKIETFPYTKYGTIKAQVMRVSNDAINDKERGLIFSSRIKLLSGSMQVEHKTINFSPGMAVSVEIKIGKRRVIEYFLSPLMQYTSESLRER